MYVCDVMFVEEKVVEMCGDVVEIGDEGRRGRARQEATRS